MVRHRAKKDSENIEKYQLLRWELTKQYPGYKVVQLNVIMDRRTHFRSSQQGGRAIC